MGNAPCVLFRKDGYNRDEYTASASAMPTLESRTECRNRLVVGRYSVLPFYAELERDLTHGGSRLINTHSQHDWIAGFHYYEQLRDYTFPTWDQRTWPLCGHPGPFVVKGRTNSRKHQWNTRMFAEDKRAANEVALMLLDDPLISQQGVVYRQYVPLRTFEIGLNGLPFTNEWRFFYLGETRLAHGYYWTEADNVESPRISEEGLRFADSVAKVVANNVNFFVLDVAEKADGGWILVEVNDGQMSGLSMIEPKELYAALAETLIGFQPAEEVDFE